MADYGIIRLIDCDEGYRAKVPKADGGYHKKQFVKSKFNHPKVAAILWRDKTGREEWGAHRWDIILNTGNIRSFRSKSHAVFIYKYNNKGYEVWRVDWLEGGKKKSKIFGSRRYGDLDKAGVAANLFAANRRAIQTGGNLSLSESIFFEVSSEG